MLFNLKGFFSICLNLEHCSEGTKINSTNSSGNSVAITNFQLFVSFHPNSFQFSQNLLLTMQIRYDACEDEFAFL